MGLLPLFLCLFHLFLKFFKKKLLKSLQLIKSALYLYYQLRTTTQKHKAMTYAVAPQITVQKFQAANNATCVAYNVLWDNCSSPKITVCSLWEKFGKRRVYVDAVLTGNGKVFAKLGYICLDTNKFVMVADKVTTRQMWAEFVADCKFVEAAPAAPKKICRRAVMRRAHEIAAMLQGDRAACLSFALKQAWAEAKAA